MCVALQDWVALRRIRPLPPPTPSGFHTSLTTGSVVEMLFEDGWWQGTLAHVGERDLLPPVQLPTGLPADAGELTVGTQLDGLDGEPWHVVEGSGGANGWAPVSGRAWPSKRAGDDQAVYAIRTHPDGHVHVVDAPDLRAARLWQWRPNRWDVATSLKALAVYGDIRVNDERRRQASICHIYTRMHTLAQNVRACTSMHACMHAYRRR